MNENYFPPYRCDDFLIYVYCGIFSFICITNIKLGNELWLGLDPTITNNLLIFFIFTLFVGGFVLTYSYKEWVNL
jgi:hypothetical protein